MTKPFVLVSPATRGLSLALTRFYLTETSLPIYATHRSLDVHTCRERILSGLPSSIDSSRLTLIPLELTQEGSIAAAADALATQLPNNPRLHTAWITGGILYPEKSPQDIDASAALHSFKVNVISHLLMIKHFSRFLPASSDFRSDSNLSKWVHVSARVGSISDNQRGGWYSYRSSKAALNQVIKTFDLQLQMQNKKGSSIAIGVHPGTVKTDLSKEFWKRVPHLFEPEDAARKLVKVVDNLRECDRGKVWDWAGKQVPW